MIVKCFFELIDKRRILSFNDVFNEVPRNLTVLVDFTPNNIISFFSTFNKRFNSLRKLCMYFICNVIYLYLEIFSTVVWNNKSTIIGIVTFNSEKSVIDETFG